MILESKWSALLGTSRYSLVALAEYRQLIAGQKTYVAKLLKGLRQIVREVPLLREVTLSLHHSLDVQRMVRLLVLSDLILNERPNL